MPPRIILYNHEIQMKKQAAFIALGSNQGNRLANLRRSLVLLRKDGAIGPLRQSKVYETSPLGPRQRDFLNAVVRMETVLGPEALLGRLKKIEGVLGRKSARKRKKWGPRPIDLDILFIGKLRMKSRRLTVPHPRYSDRKFVLRPLADIAPRLKPPGSYRTIRQILSSLTDGGQKVKLFRGKILP